MDPRTAVGSGGTHATVAGHRQFPNSHVMEVEQRTVKQLDCDLGNHYCADFSIGRQDGSGSRCLPSLLPGGLSLFLH